MAVAGCEEQRYYEVVDEILKGTTSNFLYRFSLLKSDEERFRLVYSNKEICKLLDHHVRQHVGLDYGKSNAVANARRLEGNTSFKNGQFLNALQAYNQCILHALHRSVSNLYNQTQNDDILNIKESNQGKDGILGERRAGKQDSSSEMPVEQTKAGEFGELSLGLANRSIVMLKLFRYSECIEDAKDAINCGYPSSQEYKLAERIATSYEQLRQYDQATESYDLFRKSLEYSELPENQRESLMRSADLSIARCKQKVTCGGLDNSITFIKETNVIDSTAPKIEIINTCNNISGKTTASFTSSTNGNSTSNNINNGPLLMSSDNPKRCFYDILKSSRRADSELSRSIDSLKKTNLLPNMSKYAIEFVYTSELGKHAVASRNLKTGEVVLADTTFAKALDFQYIDRKCYYCLCPLSIYSDQIYPCVVCSSVIYCSKKCARFSMTIERHDLECPINPKLEISRTGGMAFLVVRILFAVGLEEWLKICKSSQTIKNLKSNETFEVNLGIDKNKESNRGIASHLYNLLSHSDKRSPTSLFQYTLLAVWIILLLKKKTSFFFGNQISETTTNLQDISQLQPQQSTVPSVAQKSKKISPNNIPDDIIVAIGGVALKFLQIISCNGIEITRMSLESTLPKCHPCRIGLALYPNASLFNHSCDPDIEFIFTGNTCYARCIRPVAEGSCVNIDYGYLFYVTDREERQKSLMEQYFFKCSCRACLNNWQVKKYLEKDRSLSSKPPSNAIGRTGSITLPMCPVCLEHSIEINLLSSAKHGDDKIIDGNSNSSNNVLLKKVKRRKKKKKKGNSISSSANVVDSGTVNDPCESTNNDELINQDKGENNDNVLVIDNDKAESGNKLYYKCLICGTEADEATISGLSCLDSKLRLNQILSGAIGMKITSDTIRYLELYLDYRLSQPSPNPTRELIACLSTLKQCYRILA